MNNTQVLGICFTKETLASVFLQIKEAIQKKNFLRIATINPEFLVLAHKNETFKKSLQFSHIQLVDGFGLWLALRWKGFTGERITGIQILEGLLEWVQNEERSVAFILSPDGLTSKRLLSTVLKKKYPYLNAEIFTKEEDFSASNADIFFFSLGIPDQEYMGERLQKGIVIGVGGAVDFLTGRQKRAPKIFQKLGIEWVWRLARQPRRIQRIWNAVIIFPFLVLTQKK